MERLLRSCACLRCDKPARWDRRRAVHWLVSKEATITITIITRGSHHPPASRLAFAADTSELGGCG